MKNDIKIGLELNCLEKSFGDVRAVKGISLEVNRGEIFGLIGPDAAGKTTTMRLACGLLLPDKGTARLMGYNSISQMKQVREHLGYMPQRFSLYQDLSVKENIRFFADLYLVKGPERRKREEQLMEFSKLGPFRNRRAGALSGGMKQKLALSCTLIHTPDVLILDEPTFGVDPVSRREFWKILKNLAEDGLAILVSTPYMDEAELCNRIALMHDGILVAEGTPEQVARNFSAQLVEVKGRDLSVANEILKQVDPGSIAVHRFGDRLHVQAESGDLLTIVNQAISGREIDAKPVSPTIEDVFVQLISQSAEVKEHAH